MTRNLSLFWSVFVDSHETKIEIIVIIYNTLIGYVKIYVYVVKVAV